MLKLQQSLAEILINWIQRIAHILIISDQETCFGLFKETSQYVLTVNIRNNHFWGYI